MSYSELGKKLKSERLARGLTQAELCGEFVTRNMLSRIENGLATPSLETLSYLADRLGVPAGYFIDDSMDEREERSRRLRELAKNEFSGGDYELCLQYLGEIPDKDEGIIFAELNCFYALGYEQLMEAELSSAEKSFSRVIELRGSARDNFKSIVLDARTLLTYIKSFKSSMGDRRVSLKAVSECFGSSLDVVIFARLFTLIENGEFDAAKKAMSVTVFSDEGIRALSDGLVLFKEEKYSESKKKLIDAVSHEIYPMLKVLGYSLLEVCSAELKDFENAYQYSRLERELKEKLLEK